MDGGGAMIVENLKGGDLDAHLSEGGTWHITIRRRIIF